MRKQTVRWNIGVLGGVLGLAFIIASMFGAQAAGNETCFCVISSDNLTNKKTATGICKDLTSAVGLQFSGALPTHQKRESQCSTACTAKAAPDTGDAAIAACACAAGAAHNFAVRAYRAVGNQGRYDSAQQIGVVKRIAAVIQRKCPAGWLDADTNVDGGLTADGRCKKLSPNLNIAPYPQNGTIIPVQNGANISLHANQYGFTWGAQIWVWGTAANGGAAISTTISGPTCGF